MAQTTSVSQGEMGWHPHKSVLIVFTVWAVVNVLATAFLFLSNNANLKRKAAFPLQALVLLLFLAFVWSAGFPPQVFWFLVPATVIVFLISSRNSKFCDACGKTVISRDPFSPPKVCSRCGAPLDKPAE